MLFLYRARLPSSMRSSLSLPPRMLSMPRLLSTKPKLSKPKLLSTKPKKKLGTRTTLATSETITFRAFGAKIAACMAVTVRVDDALDYDQSPKH